MLKGYLICGIVPLLGIIAASSGDLVMISTMLTLGLLYPVWQLLANLWWVWLLGLPTVIATQFDRPVVPVAAAVLATVLASAGLTAFMQAGVARDMAAFALPPVVAQGHPLAQAPGLTLELVTDDAALLQDGPCGITCKALLGGGADWLRVTDQSDAHAPVTWIFRRGERADCTAVDDRFPPGARCILAVANEAVPAAVRVVFLRIQPQDDRDGGYAALQTGMRLQITDTRSGVVLHDATSRQWSTLRVPLRMKVDIAAPGYRSKGLHWARIEGADPALDVMQALTDLGQPLNVPASAAGRQDTALVLSMLRSGPDAMAPATARQMEAWLASRRTRADVGAAEREVLASLQQRGLHSEALQRVVVERPQLFGDGLPGLFRTATTGSEDGAHNAARALHEIVMRDPPGTHAAHEAAYLDLLRSGRNWPYVVQMAGRFTFDPAPVLKAELAARTTTTSEVFGLLMRAACLAGPEWDATLAPLVQDWLRPMKTRSFWQVYPGTQIEYFMRDVGPTGAAALRRMGREDLLQELLAQVNWDVAIQDMQPTRQVQVTRQMAEHAFFGTSDRQPGC